jgi:hypothetical protein
MARRAVPVLTPTEMLARLHVVFSPKGSGLTSSQIDEMLLEFCLNCPDPVAAMNTVLEAPQAATVEEVLSAALALPARSPATYGESELSADHPLRHWRVQLRAV